MSLISDATSGWFAKIHNFILWQTLAQADIQCASKSYSHRSIYGGTAAVKNSTYSETAFLTLPKNCGQLWILVL